MVGNGGVESLVMGRERGLLVWMERLATQQGLVMRRRWRQYDTGSSTP